MTVGASVGHRIREALVRVAEQSAERTELDHLDTEAGHALHRQMRRHPLAAHYTTSEANFRRQVLAWCDHERYLGAERRFGAGVHEHPSARNVLHDAAIARAPNEELARNPARVARVAALVEAGFRAGAHGLKIGAGETALDRGAHQPLDDWRSAGSRRRSDAVFVLGDRLRLPVASSFLRAMAYVGGSAFSDRLIKSQSRSSWAN